MFKSFVLLYLQKNVLLTSLIHLLCIYSMSCCFQHCMLISGQRMTRKALLTLLHVIQEAIIGPASCGMQQVNSVLLDADASLFMEFLYTNAFFAFLILRNVLCSVGEKCVRGCVCVGKRENVIVLH